MRLLLGKEVRSSDIGLENHYIDAEYPAKRGLEDLGLDLSQVLRMICDLVQVS